MRNTFVQWSRSYSVWSQTQQASFLQVFLFYYHHFVGTILWSTEYIVYEIRWTNESPFLKIKFITIKLMQFHSFKHSVWNNGSR